MDSIFVKGMIIGIVVSISFGPVVLTTIQKTITYSGAYPPNFSYKKLA